MWSSQKHSGVLLDVGVAVLFLLLVLVLMPMRDQFEFDTDEGLNVMKAVMVNRGYALYDDIWNDQPPVFTLILAGVFKLFGESMQVARLLVLAFGSLLIFSFHRLVRLSVGGGAAIAATLLLIGSYEFMRLNAAVMIGIPSLACAVFALVLLEQYQREAYQGGDRPKYGMLWLYGSGLCFACSLLMKLFTIVLLPLFVLQLVCPSLVGIDRTGQPSISLKQGIRDAAVWGLWVVVPTVLVAVSVNYLQLDQVLGTHLQSRQGIEEFERRSLSLAHLVDEILEGDRPTCVLAGIGILVAGIGRFRRAFVPGLWLVIGVLVLSDHQPVWYHYAPLLMVPLCWWAAYGLMPLVSVCKKIPSAFPDQLLAADGTPRSHRKRSGWRHWAAMFALGLASVLGVWAVVVTAQDIVQMGDRYSNAGRPSPRTALVQTIQSRQDNTQWFFTDVPLYAFYAGVQVPPEIVVFSKKRVLTGNLTSEKLLGLMQLYKPEQILFSRFVSEMARSKPLTRYIQTHYQQVEVSERLNAEYFVSKDR